MCILYIYFDRNYSEQFEDLFFKISSTVFFLSAAYLFLKRFYLNELISLAIYFANDLFVQRFIFGFFNIFGFSLRIIRNNFKLQTVYEKYLELPDKIPQNYIDGWNYIWIIL